MSSKDKYEVILSALSSIGMKNPFSRREFLVLTGGIMVGLSGLSAGAAQEIPVIIMDQALGLVIANPGRCVGCKRCELACTEFNDGKAWPAIARIKVTRNIHPLSNGIYATQGPGGIGSGLVVQDFCKQCPHPVPCANACPNDAIVVKPPTNARVIDPKKCVGCKMCLRACPWDMISFDSEAEKATKCFLCDGTPKCVEACPAGALSYVSWRDLTKRIPPRVAPSSAMSPAKIQACVECHKR
jgi:Fe-S-cluster-containing dehydrogenase component